LRLLVFLHQELGLQHKSRVKLLKKLLEKRRRSASKEIPSIANSCGVLVG
jgi:hypothetical protein